jgi:thiamine-phosphate pyrophosphorylase
MGSNFIQALGGTHFYPITDQDLSGLSHAEQVVLLSNCGATLIQLREKTDHPSRFFAQAEAALRVARDRGVRIIIDDRVDIALALKADGVHLGQEDLPPDAARRILGADAIIGFSTHNLEQARLAAQMPVDYIAIGPIFATTTKQSANPPLRLHGLASVRETVGTIPLVAIGGITSQNKEAVLQGGADAVAVISDIWVPAVDAAIKTKQFLE